MVTNTVRKARNLHLWSWRAIQTTFSASCLPLFLWSQLWSFSSHKILSGRSNWYMKALNRPGILTSLAPCTPLPSCLSVSRRVYQGSRLFTPSHELLESSCLLTRNQCPPLSPSTWLISVWISCLLILSIHPNVPNHPTYYPPDMRLICCCLLYLLIYYGVPSELLFLLVGVDFWKFSYLLWFFCFLSPRIINCWYITNTIFCCSIIDDTHPKLFIHANG